jgi:hypothetical protein
MHIFLLPTPDFPQNCRPLGPGTAWAVMADGLGRWELNVEAKTTSPSGGDRAGSHAKTLIENRGFGAPQCDIP